jgi:hypothetical protein
MADWNLPVLTSLYKDFLNLLKERDVDSITMGKAAITNPVVGTIRYERGTNTFQEWNGGAWVTLVVSLASGGLGSSNPADARNLLGIGTMGTQNANAVAITGGTITGLASLSSNGPIASGGGISGATVYSSQHMHAVGGIYVGNPPQLVVLPSGLIDSTKISGIIPPANLGSGAANANTVLAGDGTWKVMGMIKTITYYFGNLSIPSLFSGVRDIALSPAVDPNKSYVQSAAAGVAYGQTQQNVSFSRVSIAGAAVVRLHDVGNASSTGPEFLKYAFWVIEFQ